MKGVCQFEIEGPGLSPLHNKRSEEANGRDGTSSGDHHTLALFYQQSHLHMHPHITSCKQIEAATSKAHLVMRLIEMRIGQEPLLQVDVNRNTLSKSFQKNLFNQFIC